MPPLDRGQPAPTAREATLARQARQELARLLGRNQALVLRGTDSDQAPPIELPLSAARLLMDILGTMADGRGVRVIPEDTELTTAQAADILNVSRPFLIKLVAQASLPSRKVGTHRRVRLEDVLAYKARIDADREAILDQLVAEAQESDMGYATA